jgi:hypothetical protein
MRVHVIDVYLIRTFIWTHTHVCVFDPFDYAEWYSHATCYYCTCVFSSRRHGSDCIIIVITTDAFNTVKVTCNERNPSGAWRTRLTHSKRFPMERGTRISNSQKSVRTRPTIDNNIMCIRAYSRPTLPGNIGNLCAGPSPRSPGGTGV